MSSDSKAENVQANIESKFTGIGSGRYGKILKLAHTPSKDEYKKSCYIAAIGLTIIGAVGFFIYWVMTYLPGYF